MKGGVIQKQRGLRHLSILVALLGCGSFSGLAQESAKPEASPEAKEEAASVATTAQPWTEADTRLANHYIRLLEQNPEYGNVLDLLWNLYEKKAQTALLLGYIEKAATGEEGSVTAKTLLAHLLRKNEEIDRARDFYNEVLELDSENAVALRGAAEISDQQQRYAKALALYTRLVERTPVDSEDGAAFRLRQAALLAESGQMDEAVAIWNQLLAAWPGNTALRTEIVSLLMEAGRTDDAISVLESLANSDDPELRLTSLDSLGRLYQFISDFDGASESIRKALALLHFKHHQYAELFTRYVRLHERFGKLDELRGRIEAEASRDNPSEKAVFLTREFYRLTANPVLEEKWATRLAELVPGNADYRVRLVAIRMENDRYAEAAETLDELIAGQLEAPLSLILLRVRVALNLEGREEAESILRAYLVGSAPSPEVLAKVLAFSQEHYLDDLVEHLLRDPRASEIKSGGRESAPVELARFLRERGRTRQAQETLREYVAEAGDSGKLRAARLSEISAAYRDLDLRRQAMEAIDEAIKLNPEESAYLISRAEIQIDQKDSEGALATFEQVWNQSPDLAAKTEVDQRIFSLLRGMVDEKEAGSRFITPTPPVGGKIGSVAQFRQLAAAASRNGREADEPPPKRLLAFYGAIKQAAYGQASLETRYRAAWWSFKLQDFPETYQHLTAAQAETEKPVIEIEKMLFDLAEQNDRLPFMVKHLETLAEIDPDNAREYRQRRAEVRFLLGYEDEAVRELEELASDPEATLNTLKTLASVYQRQGRNDDQVRVWQDAYRRANLFEKRRIIKQLSTTFIELEQPDEALKAQMDLIRRETDLVQKRKQFDAQLSVASRHYLGDWLRDRYTEMAQQNPFERFYPEALARIHRAAGDYQAAFLAMKRAYYMSGQDRELLAELGELAGRTKDLKSAIYYHRQLIAQSEEGADADSWQALIEMLERDLRVPESDRMRGRLEKKFAQNADFLKILALQYGDSGRFDEAVRVLEQLTNLRPWDAAAWLELGLIRKEHSGDSEGALAAFEKAIKETAEAALPAGEEKLSRYPIVAGGWYSGNETRPDRGGLATFADAVRNHYPTVEPDVQKGIIDWLNELRPEFYRVPSKPLAIRLRAIEEAARIEGETAETRKAWSNRWSDEATVSATERLWALHHSGAFEEAFKLLKERMTPLSTPMERLIFSVMSLRMGRDEVLMEWASDNRGALQGKERDRRLFPMLAASMLVQEMAVTREPAISDETLRRLLIALPDSYLTGSHLFNRTRQALPGKALLIGEILAEGAPRNSGDFLFSVAKVAEELGDLEGYRYWLERSLEAMEPSDNLDLPDPGLPHSYFTVVNEYYALLESASEREKFLSEQIERIESNPRAPEWVKRENRALLALVSRESGTALTEIRKLLSNMSLLVQPSPRAFSFRSEPLPISEAWSMRERILRQLAPRQFPEIDPMAFYRATGDLAAPPPVNEDIETREQFEQFEIVRLVWLLEKLSPPERGRQVEEVSSFLHYPESRAELANLLEARGFHREAIPVYRQLILDNPEDISPLRGFLGACRKSQDFVPALDLIQKYLDKEIPTPSGLTADYLSQNHAEFLFMARDIETLTARAQEPANPVNGGPGRSPSLSESQNPWRYHNALVRAREKRSQPEALLRLLEHLRDRSQATENDRLLAGRVSRQLGENENAIEWLRGIKLDQQQTAVEVLAIRELSELYESAGPLGREKLADLARSALAYGDTELILGLAEKLYRVGASNEARSCLLLSTRKKDTAAADRTRLLGALIRSELESDSPLADVSGNLRNLISGLQPGDSDGFRGLIEIIAEFGPREKAAWVELLQAIENQPASRLLSLIGTAALQGELASSTDRILARIQNDDRNFSRALRGLTALGESGKAVARQLLDRRTDSMVTLFGGDPANLVTVLGDLDDRSRAAELQARLIRESGSDLFHQLRVTSLSGSFVNRARLPRAFEEAGFPELAGALYRRYHQDLPRLTHEHTEFIGDYVRFLINRGEFATAESTLAPALQKSIGMNPELLVDLYEAWGRLDETDEMMNKLFLSSGVRVEVEEIRAERKNG